MQNTEEQLLRQAKSGDRRAFSKLVQPYDESLVAWCARLMRGREEAEDAAQDAVLRAWANLASFRGDCSFKSWLYRIATNRCLNRMQRDREVAVQPDHQVFHSQSDKAPPPAVQAIEASLLSRIRRHLSEEDESIFVGVYELGMSSDEVSRLILRDKSIGADGVRSRLQRRIRPQIAKVFAELIAFCDEDIKDGPRLAARWSRPDDAASAYIQKILLPASVRALRPGAPPGGGDVLRGVLVAELNRVLKDADFYRQDRFAAVALRTETQFLANQKQPLVALRNRLLLEDVYSQELFKRQP